MSRTTTRILLALSVFISLVVTAIAFKSAIEGKEAAWAVIAASLAVITSVVSSWNAQRVVELEEDKQLPYPYPYFDVESRYNLVLLKVTNFGQSAAHNIELEFNEELLNLSGQLISFNSGEDGSGISILLPQQSISKTVHGQVDFFKQDKKHIYTGTIKFKNSSGKKMKHDFILDAEKYANTPTYAEEYSRTQYELQKLPKVIENINETLKRIKVNRG